MAEIDHEICETHEKILFKEESFQIQAAIFEVYKEMGCGFLECVYQECLEREFKNRNISWLTFHLSVRASHVLRIRLSVLRMVIPETFFRSN